MDNVSHGPDGRIDYRETPLLKVYKFKNPSTGLYELGSEIYGQSLLFYLGDAGPDAAQKLKKILGRMAEEADQCLQTFYTQGEMNNGKANT